jgi:hypothetical protein
MFIILVANRLKAIILQIIHLSYLTAIKLLLEEEIRMTIKILLSDQKDHRFHLKTLLAIWEGKNHSKNYGVRI